MKNFYLKYKTTIYKIIIILLLIIVIVFLDYLFNHQKSKSLEKQGGSSGFILSTDQEINIPPYDKKYIGELKTVNKKPYKIYSGRSCENCDENISLYIYSESDKDLGNTPRYSYPGKRYSIFNDNETVEFNSRVFFGNCLNSNSEQIVWFQKQLQDDGKYSESIYALEVINDELQEKTYKYDENLFKNKGENCKEIPGIDVSVEP